MDQHQSNPPTPENNSTSKSTSPEGMLINSNSTLEKAHIDSSHFAKNTRGISIFILNLFLFASIILAILFIFFQLKEKELLSLGESPKIGVVNLFEAITYETAEPVVRWIETLEKNPNVKGLVVRINCPGGTVGASQEIYEAIKRFKKRKDGNLVYVSSIDLNASGAYWVSTAADKIFANNGTAVGSIGVIRPGLSFQGLMEKLGVKDTTVTSVQYKDLGSMYKDLSEPEKEILKNEILVIHKQFVDTVWASRQNINGLTREKLENEIAIGITFIGTQALQNGLIDGLRTFPDTLQLMKEDLFQKQLIKSPDVVEVVYPPQPVFNLLDLRNWFSQKTQMDSLLPANQPNPSNVLNFLNIPWVLYPGYSY